MSWDIIELELNLLSKGVKSANKHNDSFSSWKFISISLLATNNFYKAIYVAGLHDKVDQYWLCRFTIYNFVKYLFYVLWILKIMLITSHWNVLNDMIVFLVFGYWIFFVVCVCVPISCMSYVNGKNIKWIVKSNVEKSNGEIVELVGGWRLLHVCNRVIWYCVT
jgi:hypothetical protein